ncbi:MAG: hypothetical protein KAT11_05830 [Phycisphaerae bacterium]|nr:hypothetical protein [Phycisphaerae bacterium]
MRKTKLICFAAVVLAVGVGWADGGELRPVACNPDLALFPGLMLRGRVSGTSETEVAGLGSRAITGELELPGSKQKSGIHFALDYSTEEAANPDMLLIDFNGNGKFDKDKAITLRPEKVQKSISYQAQFRLTNMSAVRQGRTFPLLLREGIFCYGSGGQYMVIISFAPAVQGKCQFGQTEYTIRLIDNAGDFRFDCKGAYDSKNPGPMRAGTGDIVLVDTDDGTFTRSFTKAFYGQPMNVDGEWYKLSVSADGGRAKAEKVNVAAGEIQIDTDKWELVLHHKGELSLLAGGRDPLPISAGKYDIMYCRRWSAPNDKGQRSCLMAADTEFILGKGSAHSISVAAGKKTTLPIGSPLSTSMTTTLKGGTVEFSLATPTIQPGLSVLIVTGDGADMYTRLDEPKVTVTDAKGKVIDEFTMEYG